MYILSGSTDKGYFASQTFMIDLSVSWNRDSPTCRSLPVGPGLNWAPSAMTADGQKWFTLLGGDGGGVAHVFDVQTNVWSKAFTFPQYGGLFQRAATTDPTTGLIYVPFSYRTTTETKDYSMLIVDLKNGSYRSDNRTFTLPQMEKFAVAWNALLKSLLYVIEAGMFSYSPSEGWRNFTGPPGLVATESFCMVSTTSGSKVVLFGGYSRYANATVGDIFILDVETLVWKKGPSTSPGDVRRTAACAMSNDQFIVWGGDTGVTDMVVPPDHLTLIYDLKTDSWVTDYTAPTAPSKNQTNPTSPGGSQPSTTISSSQSSQSTNIKVIVGAVAGGLCLGLILGGLFMYRSHRNRTNVAKPEPSEDPSDTPIPSAPDTPSTPSTLSRSRSHLVSPHGPVGSTGPTTFAYPTKGFRYEPDNNVLSREFFQSNNSTPVTAVPSNPFLSDDKKYPEVIQPASPMESESGIRRGTVQLGPYGSRPMSQHPHACSDTSEGESTYQMYYLARPYSNQTHIMMDRSDSYRNPHS